MPYSSNLDVQKDVETVRKTVIDILVLAFPTLGIQDLIDLDKDEEGDFVGAFALKDNLMYQFVIPASTRNPMIQRFAGVPADGSAE